MTLRLPSRYEDLDAAFRGRLKPNQPLLSIVKQAFAAMEISGGIRFLPIFGDSGSGKTSSALEIGTHLPDLWVGQLPRETVEDSSALRPVLDDMLKKSKGKRLVAVIDQYEEVAARRTEIPSSFVEALILLDRDRNRSDQILFIWLTTSKEFQQSLSSATSRNKRILVTDSFEISSLPKTEWPAIIEETFQFHNQDKVLSDFEILDVDLSSISDDEHTIGSAIEVTGSRLAKYATELHDLSTYQVIILWPVTDGLRITIIRQFTDPRQGYKLDWSSWYRQLNPDDQAQLPLRESNRARLYFDVRLVPVAAADLHPLCRELENDDFTPGTSYLDRFKNTHFYSIISGTWNPTNYAPLRERDSQRATQAREWYQTVTTKPTFLGKRLAKVLRLLGLDAEYEVMISSPYNKVKADVLITKNSSTPPNIIVELKALSPENTMPSTIASSVQTTLKRHAQFAGFLQRQ